MLGERPTKALPEHELLLQLLRYEPETGKLFWRERGAEWFRNGRYSAERNAKSWNKRYSGKEAFTANLNGYSQGAIFDEFHYAHRIIFKMMTGVDPIGVDHMDGVRSNNRWDNLRGADQRTNLRNSCRRVDNTSGVTGVYWSHPRQRWVAEIVGSNGKVHLGSFKTLAEAAEVRKAADACHGFSPRHGAER